MRLAQPATAAELAEELGARLLGDGNVRITGINEIHHVETGDLSFVDHPKYYAAALALLVVEQPFTVYNKLVTRERPLRYPAQAVDPSAKVADSAYLGQGVTVGPGAVIGENCHLEPNVVVAEGVELGNDVYVGAGTVIGGEAFYFKRTPDFKRTPEGYQPWRSGGSVRIEDKVEIGPNCTIARGVSSTTVIGYGTKLDALVQIGHDCKIGKHCILAAQVGVAGNTRRETSSTSATPPRRPVRRSKTWRCCGSCGRNRVVIVWWWQNMRR